MPVNCIHNPHSHPPILAVEHSWLLLLICRVCPVPFCFCRPARAACQHRIESSDHKAACCLAFRSSLAASIPSPRPGGPPTAEASGAPRHHSEPFRLLATGQRNAGDSSWSSSCPLLPCCPPPALLSLSLPSCLCRRSCPFFGLHEVGYHALLPVLHSSTSSSSDAGYLPPVSPPWPAPFYVFSGCVLHGCIAESAQHATRSA